MKKNFTFPQYINRIFLLIGIIAFYASPVFAQVYKSTGYYYNNFDNGTLGSDFTKIGTVASLSVTSAAATNNLAIENGYSLTSIQNNTAGGYALSFMAANTNLNNEGYGYEWTMIYKNTATLANSDVVDNNEDSWKYWLFAENSTLTTAKGYFLTQVGTVLYLRWKYDNSTDATHYNELISYDLANIGGNNVTYAIRVQRVKRQGQYVWHLFVDPYTSTTREAKTERGTESYESTYGTYAYSALLSSNKLTGATGTFKFDEMKMYSMKLTMSGANSAAYGITTPVYAGQQGAVLYGIKVETRGFFDIYQIAFNTTDGQSQLIQNASLRKSYDNYFGNGDDVFVTDLDVQWNQIQRTSNWNNGKDTFYSIGNADGSITTACYYYVSANILTNPSSSYTISFTGAPTIYSNSEQINYVGAGDATLPTTPATNAGKTYDWVGGTSVFWNNSANWSPNTGVPGASDVARIGVISFGTYQPTVSATTTVGNVILGNAKSAYLTVNTSQTLTVNGTVTIQGGSTLDGSGILDIKGNVVSGNTSATGIEVFSFISTLNANSVVLNSANANTAFTSKGASINLKEAIQTISSANQSTFTLASTSPTATSVLTLTGATPLALTAGNNVVNFAADNATVEYAGATAQKVYASAVTNLNGTLSYKNIKFSGAGTKTVAAGTLTVAGNWNSASGKVDLATNNTTASFTGTTAQAINDTGSDSGTGIVFGKVNFSGDGTKTLSSTGKFSVGTTGILTMAGSTSLVTSGNLTLKSASTSTATVATIPATASITGNVTVERYVQGGAKAMYRTYRMFSSPIYDNSETLITTNTPGNRTYKFNQFIDDMIITGSGGAANGFDATTSNTATAFTYNSNYVAVTNITTAVNAGRGTYIFYRGNRSNMTAKTTGTFTDPESIVMTFKGFLNQQTINVPLTYGTATNGTIGYNLVGNPYAASIDWNSANLTKTNIENTIRIWNPAKKQYATYNGIDSVNGGSRYIGSGQAFFVQAKNSSAALTFKETAKVGSDAQPTTLLMGVGDQKESDIAAGTESLPSRLRITLLKDQAENTDESVIVFKQGGDLAYAAGDVSHLNGEEVFLSSLSTDQKQLAINYVPQIADVSHVGLYVSSTSSGNYSLKFNLEEVPAGYSMKLMDRFLNSITDISEDFEYQLVIDKADTASFGSNRFVLMFSPPATLPVAITTFTAAKANNGVLVKWTTATEVNNNHFEVERAGDNGIFVNIGQVSAKGAGAYTFTDKNPLLGNNYYRLKQVDNDNKATTNDPVQVKFDSNLNNLSDAAISIYPNPVVDHFTVKYNGSLTSDSNIVTLISPSGQVILSKTLTKEDLTNGYSLDVAAQATGVYLLSVKDGSNSKSVGTMKMIKL